MIQLRFVLALLAALSAISIGSRGASAATIIDCPATDTALRADIGNVGSGGTVYLVCSNPTVIPVGQVIILRDVTLDATYSLGTVTLAGQTSATGDSSFQINGASLSLIHLTLSDATITNSGTLHIRNSVVSGTLAGRIVNSGTADIANSSISVSFVLGFLSPGVSVVTNTGNATLIVNNSTFTQNKGGPSGGAINNAGTLSIANSTFQGNSAEPSGGETGGSEGGAIYNSGTGTVANSTFSDNTALSGNYVYNAGRMTFIQDTFAANPTFSGLSIVNAGTMSIGSTILANAGANCDGTGTVTDLGYNLTDGTGVNGDCGLTSSTDKPNTDPMLDPRGLETNGGPTPTIALLPSSPAIDAGPTSCTPNTDQRGVRRPQGRACDIGAFEFVPSTDLIANGSFEQGQSPWQTYAASGHPIIISGYGHTGTHSALLCGYNNCRDALWQTFTVPTTFGRATLSLWLSSVTQEQIGLGTGSCNDVLYVLLLAPNGSIISSPLGACNSNMFTWGQSSVDVSLWLAPYRGQQVTLLVLATSNATLPSYFFMDDISLQLSPPGTASTRPTTAPSGALHPIAAPSCIAIPGSPWRCTNGE